MFQVMIQIWHRDTVADWLERSACNAYSTDSSLVQDSYWVGTMSKFFTYNALQYHRCICATKAIKCFVFLRKKGNIKVALCCIVTLTQFDVAVS